MGRQINYPKLLASIVVCFVAAAIGSYFTITGPGSWYQGLEKPAFQPPDWVFGPVWTLLYILMGVSAYMVWEEVADKERVKWALLVFGVQLGLNVLWSFAFFGMQSTELGFAVVALLWGAILVNIDEFKKVHKNAWALLIPYFLWVSFAAVLNFAIMLMN